MVADIEELETMDASEINSKRLDANEVIIPKENGNFIFPVADGRINFAGGDQELRTSTMIRDHPIRGESRRDGQKNGSPRHGFNRRRRNREGLEPACVQTPWRWSGTSRRGRMN